MYIYIYYIYTYIYIFLISLNINPQLRNLKTGFTLIIACLDL